MTDLQGKGQGSSSSMIPTMAMNIFYLTQSTTTTQAVMSKHFPPRVPASLRFASA